MKKTENNKDIIRAFRISLPVMAGYLVLGMGFGIMFSTKGYGEGWAALSSLLVYAGSLQYVMVDLIAKGASLMTVAVTALMVNARHLFYGISMIERYKGAGWKKPYLMFALTDETYSLVCSDVTSNGVKDRYRFYFFLSLFNQCYWIAGSLLGAFIGGVMEFNSEGIDFVLTALFVTIFTEQWMSTKNHKAAVTGILSSAICLFIFGADKFLIPAMICIAVIMTILRSKLDENTVAPASCEPEKQEVGDSEF